MPPLVRAASEWTWRLLILGAGLVALFFVVSYFSQIVVPLAIGLLLCALLSAVHTTPDGRFDRYVTLFQTGVTLLD